MWQKLATLNIGEALINKKISTLFSIFFGGSLDLIAI